MFKHESQRFELWIVNSGLRSDEVGLLELYLNHTPDLYSFVEKVLTALRKYIKMGSVCITTC